MSKANKGIIMEVVREIWNNKEGRKMQRKNNRLSMLQIINRDVVKHVIDKIVIKLILYHHTWSVNTENNAFFLFRVM